MSDLQKRLKNCQEYAIDMRLHVIHFRLATEQINEEDIRENLKRLQHQDFSSLLYYKAEDSSKFILYFSHTKNIVHKYVIDIRDAEKVIRLVTVHKIHKDSQKRFEQNVFR